MFVCVIGKGVEYTKAAFVLVLAFLVYFHSFKMYFCLGSLVRLHCDYIIREYILAMDKKTMQILN